MSDEKQAKKVEVPQVLIDAIEEYRKDPQIEIVSMQEDMYRQRVHSEESVSTTVWIGGHFHDVNLVVGEEYVFHEDRPTKKNDRKRLGRRFKIKGFTDNWFGDVVVKYLDNNRTGRVTVSNCAPAKLYDDAIKDGLINPPLREEGSS